MSSSTSSTAIAAAAATPPVLSKSYSGEERVPECTSPSPSPSKAFSPSKHTSERNVTAKHNAGNRVVQIASNQEDQGNDDGAVFADDEAERGDDAATETSSTHTCLKDTLKRVQANDEAITELDLSEMSDKYALKLQSSGGALVARVMEMNHTVGRLALPDHAIGDTGALAMADMLRMNSTIRQLDLCGNGITDVGCKGLADALYGHDSLHHLALWSNNIGDEGAKALAQALQVNRSLTYVGLVGNNIGEEGARALLEAVQLNPLIQTLGLAVNPMIPHELQHELKIALAANKAAAMTMTIETGEDDNDVCQPVAPVTTSVAGAQMEQVNDDDRDTAVLEYDSGASSGDESESGSETDDEAHVTQQAEDDDDDDDDDEFWV